MKYTVLMFAVLAACSLDGGDPKTASLVDVKAALDVCSVKIRNFDAQGVAIYDDEVNAQQKIKCLQEQQRRKSVLFAISGPIPAGLRTR